MPEQFDDGWQQKFWMKTNMVKILTEELRPFVLKVDGNAPKKTLVVCLLFLFMCVCVCAICKLSLPTFGAKSIVVLCRNLDFLH